jgi:hypothetical protein
MQDLLKILRRAELNGRLRVMTEEGRVVELLLTVRKFCN